MNKIRWGGECHHCFSREKITVSYIDAGKIVRILKER